MPRYLWERRQRNRLKKIRLSGENRVCPACVRGQGRCLNADHASGEGDLSVPVFRGKEETFSEVADDRAKSGISTIAIGIDIGIDIGLGIAIAIGIVHSDYEQKDGLDTDTDTDTENSKCPPPNFTPSASQRDSVS